MKSTILDVKKEYDQLDDLLNADSILFKSQRWKVLSCALMKLWHNKHSNTWVFGPQHSFFRLSPSVIC